MSDFKPSQVFLGVPPLVGTMTRAEIEFAAAVVIRACQVGDVWKPVTLDEIERVIRDDHDKGREPFASLVRNPFFRPNFEMLAGSKFGRWIGDRDALELTPDGIEALCKWVQR